MQDITTFLSVLIVFARTQLAALSLPTLKRKDSKQRNLTNALLLLPLLGTMTSVCAWRTGELKLLHLSTVALPLLTTPSLLALSADAIIPLTNAVGFKISSLSTSRSSLTVPGLPRASLILAAARQGTSRSPLCLVAAEMHATTLAAGVGAGVEAAEDSMVAGVEGAQPFCTGEVPACTSKGEVLPPIMPFGTTLTVFRCAQSRRRRKTMPFAPLCKQTARLHTSLEPQRASRPKARSLWSRSPPTTKSLSPLPALTLRRSLRRRSTGCSTAALTRRSLSTRLPTSSAQTAVTAARKSLRHEEEMLQPERISGEV